MGILQLISILARLPYDSSPSSSRQSHAYWGGTPPSPGSLQGIGRGSRHDEWRVSDNPAPNHFIMVNEIKPPRSENNHINLASEWCDQLVGLILKRTPTLENKSRTKQKKYPPHSWQRGLIYPLCCSWGLHNRHGPLSHVHIYRETYL